MNARLRLTSLDNAVMVPAAAVQRGPQSTFVYVVQRNAPATRPATPVPMRGLDPALGGQRAGRAVAGGADFPAAGVSG